MAAYLKQPMPPSPIRWFSWSAAALALVGLLLPSSADGAWMKVKTDDEKFKGEDSGKAGRGFFTDGPDGSIDTSEVEWSDPALRPASSANSSSTITLALARRDSGLSKKDRARLQKSTTSRMVDVKAGCFQMGSPEGTGNQSERPQHEVCLDAFRLDQTPVTQEAYLALTGESPWLLCEGPLCTPPSPKHPAWYVTWTEADAYCKALGKRLPTEAEYEYAVRAGSTTIWPWGDTLFLGCKYANIADLSLRKAFRNWVVANCDDASALIAPVGSYKANAWGLQDMTGNVWHWTADWYSSTYYQTSLKDNPKGPASGTGRTMRGGSWMGSPEATRSAFRDGFPPEGRYPGSIGFRCAMEASRDAPKPATKAKSVK
ncbi:MAG: SUMF1/EgtB/PvdO family nonheme iron enzyme [Fibrobacterota bacterium]|nr:MAG: SUMF1/EgtB/PvdO family nonheme iron enzyme [Fibrobacterota bacterium]